jgi:hypothetical protein
MLSATSQRLVWSRPNGKRWFYVEAVSFPKLAADVR